MPGEIDVRKYIGIPYKHNGRNNAGVDCLGLMLLILKDVGIKLPNDDGEIIKRDWFNENPMRFIQGLEQYGEKIDITELQPLDVVVFCFQGIPRHAGVMVDRSHFIHIRENGRVSVTRLKRYSRFFYAAYRMTTTQRGETD